MVNMIKTILGVGLIIPVVLAVGGVFYSMGDLQAYNKLRSRIDSKLEKIADENGDGELDVREMSNVYKSLNLSPAQELRKRGFILSVKEIQKYLQVKGKYDASTDDLKVAEDGFGL